MPLLRVEDGDYTAIKQALIAQVNNGFKPGEGCIFAVGLLSHLCRVGSQHFWRELEDFSRWCQGVFKATVWPFLPPFPAGFPSGCLVTIHRFLTELQGRYLGDFQGRVEGCYTLWYPLDRFFNERKVSKTEMSAEHIFVGAENGSHEKLIICPTDGWGGINANFESHVPEDIENGFWNIFFSHLRGSIPPSMVIELPDPASLAASLTRGAVVPVAAQQVATVPTIHLVGNSMSSRVAGPLQVYLEDEFQVNAVIFTGGPWEQARLDIPVLKDGRDVLVLNVLGNQIFKGRHYSAQGKIHLEDPDYLSNQELATLVDKLVNTIRCSRGT